MEDNSVAQLQDFSFLDRDEFKSKYATGATQNEMQFYVAGVHCGSGVRKLEDLPISVEGLRHVRVEMEKSLVHVEVDPSRVAFSTVAEKIGELGYEPIPLKSEMALNQLKREQDRTELIRLAVAAACAGGIMIFAHAAVFSWAMFALSIPVVTYVTWPFYLGAWRSLKAKQFSIDLPIAVVAIFGFLISTLKLGRGHSDIYFGSLSGFLFLILAARWAQSRMQRRFVNPREIIDGFKLQRVRRVESAGWNWRPLESLMIGDRIVLHAPEVLPAEAALQSSRADFSLAWLSGEVRPRTFSQGGHVPAGARLVSGEAQLSVLKPLAQTGFGKILTELQDFSLTRNRAVMAADRLAQNLLISFFAVALIYISVHWSVSPEQAIERALALIVIACPCAMAFGVPLALSLGLRRAQDLGLIIRDADVFDQLKEIDTVFFDITGTLTAASLTLVSDFKQIPAVYQKIVLALENESLHPIAFALREAFSPPEKFPPVDLRREIPGVGVSGFVYGKFYELKQAHHVVNEVSCTLFEEENPVQHFVFEAKLKPEALNTLTQLRAMGLRTVLISGDKSAAVRRVAEALNFKTENVHAGLSPVKKAELVKDCPRSLMLGDGVNDGLALMQARLGVAASGGVEAALKSADVYFTEDSLAGLVPLFQLGQRTRALVSRNLWTAVVYNLVAGAAALTGLINPFVAAALIPVSSAYILIVNWWAGSYSPSSGASPVSDSETNP